MKNTVKHLVSSHWRGPKKPAVAKPIVKKPFDVIGTLLQGVFIAVILMIACVLTSPVFPPSMWMLDRMEEWVVHVGKYDQTDHRKDNPKPLSQKGVSQ